MYTAGKISTCPDQKNPLPSQAIVTTKVYVPWDQLYMPRALISSPRDRFTIEKVSSLLAI